MLERKGWACRPLGLRVGLWVGLWVWACGWACGWASALLTGGGCLTACWWEGGACWGLRLVHSVKLRVGGRGGRAGGCGWSILSCCLLVGGGSCWGLRLVHSVMLRVGGRGGRDGGY